MNLRLEAPTMIITPSVCLTVVDLLLFAGVTASSLIFGTRTREDFLVDAIVPRGSYYHVLPVKKNGFSSLDFLSLLTGKFRSRTCFRYQQYVGYC